MYGKHESIKNNYGYAYEDIAWNVRYESSGSLMKLFLPQGGAIDFSATKFNKIHTGADKCSPTFAFDMDGFNLIFTLFIYSLLAQTINILLSPESHFNIPSKQYIWNLPFLIFSIENGFIKQQFKIQMWI